MALTTRTINGSNQWTDWVSVSDLASIAIVTDDSWEGTIWVQRKLTNPNDGNPAIDVESFTTASSAFNRTIENGSTDLNYVRVGTKSGGFSAGSATVYLSV